jgi:hypothetical protein
LVQQRIGVYMSVCLCERGCKDVKRVGGNWWVEFEFFLSPQRQMRLEMERNAKGNEKQRKGKTKGEYSRSEPVSERALSMNMRNKKGNKEEKRSDTDV